MLLQQKFASAEAVKLALLRKASVISDRNTSDRKVNSSVATAPRPVKTGLLDVIFGRPTHVGKVNKILFKELMG